MHHFLFSKERYTFAMNSFTQKLLNADQHIIQAIRRIDISVARGTIGAVFLWFGVLKIIGVSSAGPLVYALFYKTIPIVSFDLFFICFGLFEMVIGAAFILKGHERVALVLLAFHMIMTFLPLVLLPQLTWKGILVPTLEGQYIIKNMVIIAAALGIASHMTPLSVKRQLATLSPIKPATKKPRKKTIK